MARRPKLKRTISRAPKTQVIQDAGAAALSQKQWSTIAQDAWQSIISAIGTRAPFEQNLRTAYALYERDNYDSNFQDEPYVDSTNLTPVSDMLE